MVFSVKFPNSSSVIGFVPGYGNKLSPYYMGPKHTGELWVYSCTPLPNLSGNTSVMMTSVNDKKRRPEFYVVQVIDVHSKGKSDLYAMTLSRLLGCHYVIVPYTWMIVRHGTDQKSVIAYPNIENPHITRDRVLRKERCNNEWYFYMAIVKYESDTYRDAEYWTTTRSDYEPSVEPESRATVAEPELTLNEISPSDNVQPECSRSEQPVIIQDTRSTECDQIKETASASYSVLSSTQSRNENLQDSLPMQGIVVIIMIIISFIFHPVLTYNFN